MDTRYAPFNITTGVALLLTAWVAAARARGVRESNWPLLYYFGIFLYSNFYPGYLEPRWIYAGLVAALFLRFEFMGGAFLKLVRAVEYIILGFFLYTFATTLAL